MDPGSQAKTPEAWCRFSIAGKPLRLPLCAVVELVPPPAQLIAVPGVSRGVLGVFPHRREIVAVLDPGLAGDRHKPSPETPAPVLLVRAGLGVVGLPIDPSSMTIVRRESEMIGGEATNSSGTAETAQELDLEKLWGGARELATESY